jgi:hypothetical protein
VPAELEHLVEKEHAVVREAHFAGTRLRSAADERRVRDGVMRRAERTHRQQPVAGAQQAGDRMHGGDIERLVEGERRQNAGDAPRHHRLPGARRAHHEQIVSAGRCDLEGAPREQLAAHIGKVGQIA